MPAAALMWLAALEISGDRTAYTSGPASAAHGFIEKNCEACHVRAGSVRKMVLDRACLVCHDAPSHAAGQMAAPTCGTCHREHNGRHGLTETPDAWCVSCHGSLAITSRGATFVARNVRAFPAGHPEFPAAQRGARDPGSLTFNHQLHLKAALPGPSGPEQLECSSCHKPELARAPARRQVMTGRMTPIRYADQCARCHPLQFDARVGTPAPHDEPGQVRAALRQIFANYIATHPEALRADDPLVTKVVGERTASGQLPARTPEVWVERQTVRSERYLWTEMCGDCHLLSGLKPSDGLPVVASARVDAARMPHATFDHTPHLIIDCTSCHAAHQSRHASDVLMPPGARCAVCHAPGKGAESRCFECHGYHDWPKARLVKPVFRFR